MVGWSVCWSVGWLVGWLVALLIGWLVGLLVGWVFGWFLAWLVGWLIGWLVGWLVGYIQIEGIDHTDIQANKRNAERDLYTDQGNTLDQHIIHQNTPRSQLHLNRHHNPNQMTKPIKYNTTQPTPDPTCTNTTSKKSTHPSDQQDTNKN